MKRITKLVLTFLSAFLVINLCNLKQRKVNVIAEAFKLTERVDASKYLFYTEDNLANIATSYITNDFDKETLIEFAINGIARYDEIIAEKFIDYLDYSEDYVNLLVNTINKKVIDVKINSDDLSRGGLTQTVAAALIALGMSTVAVATISTAVNVVATTAGAWLVPFEVKALIIAGAILVIGGVILFYWQNIFASVEIIIDEFVRVAKKFATTITNTLNGIFNNASEVASKPVTLDRAKAEELTSLVESRDKVKPYYPAIVGNNTVMVIPTPMEQNQAIDRLKKGYGNDTWTINEGLARTPAWFAGMDVPIEHPTHVANEENIQFEHFHTNPKNGSHSLYGLPFQLW